MRCFVAFVVALTLILAVAITGEINTLDSFEYVNAGGMLMMVSNMGGLGRDIFNSFGYDLGTFYPYSSIANIENGTEINSPLYAAGLWLGGVVDGQTRVAVAEYSYEFTPGPMSGGTFLPDAYTNADYRVYKLFADSGSTNPNTDYSEWPSDQGAPVDGFGLPAYMTDQTLWTVFNDADSAAHTVGETGPLGVEVHQTVWAADRSGERNTIYVKYKLYNKGGRDITDFCIGFWLDPDIGWREDDKSGTDTLHDIFYNYNGDNDDDGVYGAAPPAIGARLVYGPIVPSAGDSAWFDGVWISDYRNERLTSAVSYINGTDPGTAEEHYNCMNAKYPTGEFLPLGLRFSFPGDPVAGTGELDPLLTDKKIVGSIGPLTFNPGDSQCVLFKLAVGQGGSNLLSVTDMKQALTAEDDIVMGVAEDAPDALPSGIALLQNYPNPFNPGTTIGFALPARAPVRIEVFNILGQRVRTLVNRVESAGRHEVAWNGTDDSGRRVTSGVYFYRATLGDATVTRKMLLLK